MTPTSIYLPRDEYIDSRNTQDHQLNEQLQAIRNSTDVVKRQIGQLDGRLDDIRVEVIRMSARFQNNNLRNPILPISPVVAYRPHQGGIIQPSVSLYPKNANEFYALRFCETPRQRKMLDYLVDYYDAPKNLLVPTDDSLSDDHCDTGLSSDSGHTSESSASSHDPYEEPRATSQSNIVDFLEGILGLKEDNFIRFRKQATRHRSTHAIKRNRQPADPLVWRPAPVIQKKISQAFDIRRYDKTPSSDHENKSDETKLLWGTPSEAAAARKRIRAHPPSHDGSTTNANTLSGDA